MAATRVKVEFKKKKSNCGFNNASHYFRKNIVQSGGGYVVSYEFGNVVNGGRRGRVEYSREREKNLYFNLAFLKTYQSTVESLLTWCGDASSPESMIV